MQISRLEMESFTSISIKQLSFFAAVFLSIPQDGGAISSATLETAAGTVLEVTDTNRTSAWIHRVSNQLVERKTQREEMMSLSARRIGWILQVE